MGNGKAIVWLAQIACTGDDGVVRGLTPRPLSEQRIDADEGEQTDN